MKIVFCVFLFSIMTCLAKTPTVDKNDPEYIILSSINKKVIDITNSFKDYEKAYPLIDSAIQIGYKSEYYQKISPIIANYSVILQREGRFKEAIECIDKLIPFHYEMDSLYYGILLSKRGIVYQNIDQLDSANHDLSLAIQVLQNSSYKILIADAYSNLANVNEKQNDLYEAINNYEKASVIYYDLGYNYAGNVCVQSMANIYSNIHLYDESIKLLWNLKESNSGTDRLNILTSLLNILNETNRINDEKLILDESKKFYAEFYDSLAVFDKFNIDSKLLLYYLNIDSINQAHHYFNNIINSEYYKSREVLITENIIEVFYYYIKTKNNKEAKKIFLTYGETLKKSGQNGVYEILYEYSILINDESLQNKLLRESLAFYKDENRQIQMNKSTFLFARFEFEKKETAIKLQQAEISILEQKNTNNSRIILFTIITLLLVVFVFVFVLRSMKLQKLNIKNEKEILRLETIQLSHEIEMKNSKISKIETDLHESNEEIEVLKETIDFDAKLNKTKNEFFSLFSQENIQDKYWSDFKNRFDKIPSEYFEKLLHQFPQLTASDKKLCVLIKVNMSSKEIANILLISPKSVDQKKYRLKKKIALETDEELSRLIMV